MGSKGQKLTLFLKLLVLSANRSLLTRFLLSESNFVSNLFGATRNILVFLNKSVVQKIMKKCSLLLPFGKHRSCEPKL